MGLLDLLFGSKEEPAAQDDAIADVVIDRIVAATDKRLALVPGYRKALRGGALGTLHHLRAMVQAVPGPIDVGAAAWAQDRSLRPLLAHAEDAPRAFSGTRAVREFFANSVADSCYAMLAFDHVERRVLAPVSTAGGDVHREVARTTVSFNQPRVLGPAAEIGAMRFELGKRSIDFLALQAMARITATADEKKALVVERALLKTRLSIAERGGQGLSGLAGKAPTHADAATLERELAENEKALTGHSPTGLMQELLGIVRDVLENPATHIRYETSTLGLDPMNFKVEPPDTPDFTLPIVDLWLGDRGPFTAIIARFPRGDLLPERDLASDAEKYL